MRKTTCEICFPDGKEIIFCIEFLRVMNSESISKTKTAKIMDILRLALNVMTNMYHNMFGKKTFLCNRKAQLPYLFRTSETITGDRYRQQLIK